MNTDRKVRSTKDYRLFEPYPYNRDVKKIALLERSMSKYGFDDGLPIRCVRNGNGTLKITHGHHRFYVAQKLGLPVFFVVATNDIPLFESEASSHAWNVEDFTTARARAGERAAIDVLNYRDETGIPLNACISMLGGEGASSGNKAKEMKTGAFKIAGSKHAASVAEIIMHCKDCGVQFATNSYFVKAISKCLFVQEFDVELFMHKVSTHSSIMEPRRGIDEYLDLIELVYNRQSQKKIPIAFMAKRESQERRACVKK